MQVSNKLTPEVFCFFQRRYHFQIEVHQHCSMFEAEIIMNVRCVLYRILQKNAKILILNNDGDWWKGECEGQVRKSGLYKKAKRRVRRLANDSGRNAIKIPFLNAGKHILFW